MFEKILAGGLIGVIFLTVCLIFIAMNVGGENR